MKILKSILVLAVFLSAGAAAQAQEIFEAVKSKDLAKVKALIEKNVSLTNAKDNLNNTPLHYAAECGHIIIVELLISKGADVNSANDQLNTPLNLAIINGKDDVSGYLIKNGSNLHHKNISGYLPLHLAARHGRKSTIELLIKQGVDLDSRDNFQMTPLIYLAMLTENVDAARLLIQKGADVNAKDVNGRTPLNLASYRGSQELIDLLLDNGAYIDTDRLGPKHFLRLAARKKSVRLFKVLAEKGGEDLFIGETDNKLLMQDAISGGSLEIVKMLLSKKISIHSETNSDGWTLLHYAANGGHSVLIKLLVEKGVDINKRANDGRSAYNIAEEKDYKEVLSLIANLGGDTEPQKFPILKGPYFGQTPPGNEPKTFASGIISVTHSTISISPDGREMYWATKSSIWFTKLQNGKWTKPAFVSFSGIRTHDDVPFVSPDNRKLFFTSRRPLVSGNTNKENIWFVERTSTGWSDPKPVSPVVNAMELHWQVSVSNSGTLYFGGERQDSIGGSDIYYSQLENGEYTKPINMGPIINSENGETCPFISPDESYLLFIRIFNGHPELFISFKGNAGQWLAPKKFGQFSWIICPMVSPDGKYFFYNGNQWVSTQFIEEMR